MYASKVFPLSEEHIPNFINTQDEKEGDAPPSPSHKGGMGSRPDTISSMSPTDTTGSSRCEKAIVTLCAILGAIFGALFYKATLGDYVGD